MCFAGRCPAEDLRGECTRVMGPFPCDAEEVFAEDNAVYEPEEE